MTINLAQVGAAITTTVTVASVVVNILPKSTVFDNYPRFKKAYETGVGVLSALAVNVRKQLPSLQVHIPGLGFKSDE